MRTRVSISAAAFDHRVRVAASIAIAAGSADPKRGREGLEAAARKGTDGGHREQRLKASQRAGLLQVALGRRRHLSAHKEAHLRSSKQTPSRCALRH